jgi:hypothetical protein
MGLAYCSGLALTAGGAVTQAVSGMGGFRSADGAVRPWQVVFFVVGAASFWR